MLKNKSFSIGVKTSLATGGIVLLLFMIIGIGAGVRLNSLINTIWIQFENQISEIAQKQMTNQTQVLEQRMQNVGSVIGKLVVLIPNLYDVDPIIKYFLNNQELKAVAVYSNKEDSILTQAWKDEDGQIHFQKIPNDLLNEEIQSQMVPYFGVTRAKKMELLEADADLSAMSWDDDEEDNAAPPQSEQVPEVQGELLGEVRVYYTTNYLKAAIEAEKTSIASDLVEQRGQVSKILQRESLWLTSGILLSIILLITGMFLILRSLVLRRLGMIGGMVEDIAAGEGDLTKQLPALSKDEIGTLSSSFNRFVASLHKIVIDLMSETYELSSTSDQIASTMHEIESTSQSISRSISESGVAIDRTSQSVQAINQSIQAMNQKIEQTQEAFRAVREYASQGNNAVQSSIQTMQQIENSSSKTLSSIHIIHDITTQTNLLSLNASIEAAKAGESGKGFTVVAEEMRKLAEKSANSANEIGSLSQEASQNVTQGTEIILEAGGALQEIMKSMETMSEILASLGETSSEIMHNSQEIVNNTKQISDFASHNSEATNEISFALGETTQTIEQITDSTRKIVQQIQRFKVNQSETVLPSGGSTD